MNNFDDIFKAAMQQREEQKSSFIEESKANREKCYELAETMAQQIAHSGTQFKAYLDTQVNFPHHTPNNILLIMHQRPNATQIGDYKYWKNKHVFIKKEEKDNPILILEPGDKYTREDNTVGTYYNAKKNYDISQTTAKYHNSQNRSYDMNELIQSIAQNSPVKFEYIEAGDLPQGSGALYDPSTDAIKLRKGMEDGTAIFQCITVEMGHAMLSHGNPEYNRNEHALTAFASSYMLCQKYGVDTKAYGFDQMNEIFPDMESNQIKKELYDIKKTFTDISLRLDRDLKPQKSSPQKNNQIR